MYTSVEQFLDKQYPAICNLMEEGARAAGGHYAAMTPALRRLNAEHDAAEFITQLTEVRVNRQTMRANGARPTDTGLIADDILRMAAVTVPCFEAHVRRELAADPDLLAQLLRRLRQINATFQASLTGVKIDQFLGQLPRPPESDRS